VTPARERGLRVGVKILAWWASSKTGSGELLVWKSRKIGLPVGRLMRHPTGTSGGAQNNETANACRAAYEASYREIKTTKARRRPE